MEQSGRTLFTPMHSAYDEGMSPDYLLSPSYLGKLVRQSVRMYFAPVVYVWRWTAQTSRKLLAASGRR